jgi:membrane protein implicated in regulation of membrane protease activity
VSTALRWWWSVQTPTNEPRRKPPDEVLWLIAAASIIAPIAGMILGLVGFAKLARGEAGSGWWIAGAAALIVFDYLTDIWLHRVSRETCDEPQLNARGTKHIGRVAVLNKAIEAGRGRVCLSDSWWSVEGPDLPAGARVRVVGVRGAVLLVEKA